MPELSQHLSDLRKREWVIYVCPACGSHIPIGTCGCDRPKPDHIPVPVRVVPKGQNDGGS